MGETTAKTHELHVRYVSACLIRLFPSAEMQISTSSEHANCKDHSNYYSFHRLFKANLQNANQETHMII